MRADVTSVIHLSGVDNSEEIYEAIANELGLVLVNASSVEDVLWLSSRLNKFIIVISDPSVDLGDIPIEAPVVRLGAAEVNRLKLFLSTRLKH